MLLEFWVEVMNIANSLGNCFSTKSQKSKIILKESWTGK